MLELAHAGNNAYVMNAESTSIAFYWCKRFGSQSYHRRRNTKWIIPNIIVPIAKQEETLQVHWSLL